MKSIEIKTSNDNFIAANVYEANNPETVLIIASATGVKQSFYKKFAEYFCKNENIVITFDYSGIGASLKGSIKKVNCDASDWGKVDLEAVITYAKNNYSNQKIILLGHSIGGQLIGLAKSSTEVDKIILIATQSGYWKLWKGIDRLKMWLNWYLLFPSLIKLFGYMPSKRFSGMENLPKNVAKQWSNWGRNPNYLFNDIPTQKIFYNKITSHILSISIEDDFYAPKGAVDWFVQKYENANITKQHLIPTNFNFKSIGHFGVFREKFSDTLWENIIKFVKC